MFVTMFIFLGFEINYGNEIEPICQFGEFLKWIQNSAKCIVAVLCSFVSSLLSHKVATTVICFCDGCPRWGLGRWISSARIHSSRIEQIDACVGTPVIAWFLLLMMLSCVAHKNWYHSVFNRQNPCRPDRVHTHTKDPAELIQKPAWKSLGHRGKQTAASDQNTTTHAQMGRRKPSRSRNVICEVAIVS